MRGIIPDLMMALPVDGRLTVTEETLMEIKTLHFAPTCTAYSGARRVRPVSAVKVRADGLEGATERDLAKRDRAWCGTEADAVGPMLARFREFSKLKGLVFGAAGEVSKDVDKLIGLLAYTGAETYGLAAGGTTTLAAVGALAWQLKQRLARVAHKQRAKLLLDRRQTIGPDAPRAGSGRTNAPRGARRRPFSKHEFQRSQQQQRAARSSMFHN